MSKSFRLRQRPNWREESGEMHALPREGGSWPAQSEGCLEGWNITVNDLVLAPDSAWVRLPVAQLGCGHLRVLRSPERLDSQWPKESRAVGRDTKAQQPQRPFLSLSVHPGLGPQMPWLCPGITLTLNGPEGCMTVGFGEAWQQVGRGGGIKERRRGSMKII